MEIKAEDFIKNLEKEKAKLLQQTKELEEMRLNYDDADLYCENKHESNEYKELDDILLKETVTNYPITRSSIADWITIFLGFITFGNFIYSLIYGTSTGSIEFPNKPEFNIIFQFIIFIIIESILAYIFGRLLIKLELSGRGIPIIILWLIAIISAWTSMFNVQWLLTGEITKELINSDLIGGLIFSMIIALIIAVYLIFSYIETLTLTEKQQLSKYRVSIWIQSMCYFGVFFIHIIKISIS